MRNTSGKTKNRQLRGTGEGADYIPWIKVREVSSLGTKSRFNDWKHGRLIHCLSRNETYFYHILRWDDHVIDIREQFPLERNETEKIAELLGVQHPVLGNDPNERMTTDFLVTYKDDDGRISYKAYSVKDSEAQVFGDLNDKETARIVQKQAVEMSYWKLRGVPFKIVFGDKDINKTFARNVELITEHYDPKFVNTQQDFLCYLVAHKFIEVDMENEPINLKALREKYLSSAEQIEAWKKLLSDKMERKDIQSIRYLLE